MPEQRIVGIHGPGTWRVPVHFVEEGRITVQLGMDDARTVRLKAIGLGTVVGEIGLYLGITRSAAVVADRPTTVLRLSRAALEEMERAAPEVAGAFHRWMAALPAAGLTDTTRALQAALD